MTDNWREDCPARSAGLHHAHWSDCKPTENHPGLDRSHTYTQCCHCEQFIVGTPAATTAEEYDMTEFDITNIVKQSPSLHDYVPTMVGLCLRCRAPLAAHPVAPVRVAPVPQRPGEPVPPIEPHFEPIGAQGPSYGAGRGDLTARQEKWLIGWVGLLDHIGGGR